ncbi:MAG: GIY-YIG nuclease family protein [Chloroflexi bacterium]|nr:GIY-YIG nuclease family protein [Chloroflexota bacterium]
MALRIQGFPFEGPFSYTSSVADRAGVYVVTCENTGKILDVGESAMVRTRVEMHERKPCWRRNARGGVFAFYVHYTPGKDQAARREIEQLIRLLEKPPCGEG